MAQARTMGGTEVPHGGAKGTLPSKEGGGAGRQDHDVSTARFTAELRRQHMTNPGEMIPKEENLIYPFDQAKYCLDKIRYGKLENGLRNACIESFLFNARNISDLLRGYRSRKNITYKTFLNTEGIKIYESRVDTDRLKEYSNIISQYGVHLVECQVKRTWDIIDEMYIFFIKYRTLLNELREKYPKK